MMDRLSRLVPFTGVAFAVCGVAAFGIGQGPRSDDADKIKKFFLANGTSQQISDILWSLAFVFLVLFVGSLRSYLRRAPAAEGLSAVALAGAAMMAVGAMVYFGFDYTLAVGASTVSVTAVQAVNLLALKVVIPFEAGGLILGIAGGLAILRGTGLPKWLGWLAVLSGILMAVVWLIGIFPYFLWVAIAGVLMWRRSGKGPQSAPPETVTATT